MPTTSKGIRYPSASAAPNVPQDLQNLANDVDGLLTPWTNLAASASTYDWTLPITTTWTAASGLTISGITVPSGRTMDVEFSAPLVNVNAAATVYLRLTAGGSPIGDPGVWGSGAGTAFGTPGRLNASIVGTGATVQIGLEGRADGGGGNLKGQGVGSVRIRARVL